MEKRNYLLTTFLFILIGILMTALGTSVYTITTGNEFLAVFVLILVGSFVFPLVNSFLKLFTFLGNTFLMGVLISALIDSTPVDVIENAAIITVSIVSIMGLLGSIYTNIFSKIGGALAISLFTLIIVSIGSIIIGINLPILTWVGLLIFSLYVGYDTSKVLTETDRTFDNSLSSAFSLYLNIINIFLRVLELSKRD